MKKEIKKLWVEALRSGEYNQGHSRLKNGNEYCCLGVLCDLHRKSEQGDDWGAEQTFKDCYMGKEEFPPAEVLDWAGLSDEDPTITDDDKGINMSLSSMNDRGRSFKYIADLIEEKL